MKKIFSILFSLKFLIPFYALAGPGLTFYILLKGHVPIGDWPSGFLRAFTDNWIYTDLGQWAVYLSISFSIIGLGVLLVLKFKEFYKGRQTIMAGIAFGCLPLAIMTFGMEYLVSGRTSKLGLLFSGFSTVILVAMVLGYFSYRIIMAKFLPQYDPAARNCKVVTHR